MICNKTVDTDIQTKILSKNISVLLELKYI